METEHENSRDLYNIYFMVDVSPLTQLPPTAKPGRPQPSIGLCFNDLRFSISFDRQKHWAGFPKPGHIYFSLPEIPYSACRMLMFCKTSHRASPHLPSYFCSFILFMIRGAISKFCRRQVHDLHMLGMSADPPSLARSSRASKLSRAAVKICPS